MLINSLLLSANFIIDHAATLVPGYAGLLAACGAVYIINLAWKGTK